MSLQNEQGAGDDEKQKRINENIKHTTGKVFDELFKASNGKKKGKVKKVAPA